MKVHFIGIGGIGTSALAQYYLAKGHDVSGSDLVSSEITDFLEEKGAKLLKQIPKDVELVIYSPAVEPPKIKRAKLFSYPQALGQLTKKYFTIAVSGTHGKSTTCAMISLILEKAGFDPTVIIGTKLKEFGNSNFRKGKSKYLVIEADEWQASFLNYWPKIIVLTNIEREHLDYYKDLRHILRTYREYVGHLSKDGILVANGEDKNINKIFNKFSIKKFSKKQKEAKELRKILKVPGEHNVYNALAALTVARELKISDKISFKALSEYKGAWRRFEEKELKIKNSCLPAGREKLKIISDYAHHPTEIKATLKAVREKFPDRIIWCIFQPHQYQRTFYLFDDFVKVFSKALRQTQGKPTIDKIIITDIYDVVGREKKNIKKQINSQKLVKATKKAIYLPKQKLKKYLKDNLKGGEVVIIMGAGDIYKLFYPVRGCKNKKEVQDPQTSNEVYEL